jgi:uncharacterized repeat protein (TIGR03803 family)
LYGTTQSGGSAGNGTLFAIKIDGTGFTNLHSFIGGSGSFPGITNTEGATPSAGLVLTNNTLYGTAQYGGGSGNGTIFAVNTDGTGFRLLHTFTEASFPNLINSDGANPTSDLVLSGDILYGTASGGGSAGNGTVFNVGTDGTGFTTLYSFSLTSGTTNNDGADPYAGLILSGNSVYGITLVGGSAGSGTLFKVGTDGNGFTTLYEFTARGGYTNSDGAQPWAGLILSSNSLYGAAYYGGSSGSGTIFSISFLPQLTIKSSASNIILSWPTNYAGFDYSGYRLQSTTTFSSSASWTTNLPSPVVVNGQFTITNPVSGKQQFFRLTE